MVAARTARNTFTLLTFVFLTLAAASVLAAEEVRESISTTYSRADRNSGAAAKVSKDRHSALATQGTRAAKTTQDNDFWIYSADVILFNDHDGDGHFHGIDLLFDADTYFESADVYAVVYLSLAGGPWNEYAATEIFTLNGTSADDEFGIVTELVSGYPTGSYDLLIELFDAYDDSFVAYYGPDDTSELAFLPLEDADRDVLLPPPTVVVVDKHGGGSAGWWLLLALLVVSRVASLRSPES